MIFTIYFFLFSFGLIMGSFLNCLIWRLHTGESMWGRSHCPQCKKKIFWYDNIPLLSFIFLAGRCRHCSKPISWQYPLLELITGLLFLTAFYVNFPLSDRSTLLIFSLNNILKLCRDFFAVSVMLIIFIYDLRWYLILDKVAFPAMGVVLLLNFSLGIVSGNPWDNLWKILISGIIGGSFFLIQFLASRGKWIGGGDIRLGVLMGLILGWPNILTALILAYIFGSIIGVGLIIFGKKKWDSKVPLGVFLSTATIIVLFWGQEIIDWYFALVLLDSF